MKTILKQLFSEEPSGVLILALALVGFGAGLALPGFGAAVAPVGVVFVKLLRFVAIPLILFSVIAAVNRVGSTEALTRLGGRTLLYYVGTTALAVTTGLVVVSLIEPWRGVEQIATAVVEPTTRSIGDVLMGLVPNNLAGDLVAERTLALIAIAIFIGLALVTESEGYPVLRGVIEDLEALFQRLTGWMIRMAPIGVFALAADAAAKYGTSIAESLLLYMAAVLIGLGFHAGVTLAAVLRWLGKRSPLEYFRQLMPAMAMAWSSASSAATYPITLRCVTAANVRPDTARFVLPLGATVNMDGTALYEAVAALFVAGVYGISLSLGDQIIVAMTATLASIGAAAVPGAGLVTMVIVFSAVGLPEAGIGLILAVDRILDMFRTSVNVWGDAIGAAIVDARTEEP